MSNRELPMMPWYPDQFAAATATWSYAERSAYRALLDVQWAIGVLPRETWRLATAIKLDLAEFEAIWPVVSRKFEEVSDGLRNFRLEEHRLKAFQIKKKHQAGAEVTNAKRSQSAPPGDTHSARSPRRTADAQRSAQRTPLSPSPSPDKNTPNPLKGADLALRPNGRKTREDRDRSLVAWREVLVYVDQVKDSGRSALLTRTAPLTWAHVSESCGDELAVRAAEKVGFRLIADRDKFNTADLQNRFREAYEQQQSRAATPAQVGAHA